MGPRILFEFAVCTELVCVFLMAFNDMILWQCSYCVYKFWACIALPTIHGTISLLAENGKLRIIEYATL